MRSHIICMNPPRRVSHPQYEPRHCVSSCHMLDATFIYLTFISSSTWSSPILGIHVCVLLVFCSFWCRRGWSHCCHFWMSCVFCRTYGYEDEWRDELRGWVVKMSTGDAQCERALSTDSRWRKGTARCDINVGMSLFLASTSHHSILSLCFVRVCYDFFSCCICVTCCPIL